MTLVDRIRNLTPHQQQALQSIDRAEQRAVALEDLEVEHLATEEVYRRYAIVDEAMIREAAVKMNRGAKIRRSKPRRTADS